ncbi:hypothetical protein RJT34_04424 [Clitoria ternatea]|uniref:Rapid ALkalinization Factor n=1 Tax=Clitoria ternatea TaxID=43366 RepID=A0AAN9Q3E4_CLITE
MLYPPLPPPTAGRAGIKEALETFFFLNSNYSTKLNLNSHTHPIIKKMNFKPWLAILLVAMALAMMIAEASNVHDFSYPGGAVVGDLVGEDNEMMLDSESNRRTLASTQRYISYGALKANNAPCGNRGNSYYNCQNRGRANPYTRGCSRITNCARDLN